ncbi:MAG: flagellar FlbD family protein [Bdellovibrionales bacterium]|nr:flagellar FlbD family protein [Bdellovibrionales bacterium]
MIEVSRLNGTPFFLNCELIRSVEATPDTVISLLSGEKLMVKETVDEVIRRVMDYRKRIHQEPPARA